MEIDIRKVGSDEEVDTIRFAEDSDCHMNASVLKYTPSNIYLEDGDGQVLRIESESHALNLIQALEKAMELEWFSK